MTPGSSEPKDRLWIVRIDGFCDVEISAPTKAAARYRCWRQARAAGYFAGRFGFRNFLQNLPSVYERRA